MKVTLDIPGTPPSLNKLMYRNWRVHQRIKVQWQGIFGVALMASPLRRVYTPDVERAIFATGELWFPTKRKRDEGNYRSIIEKCLGDALVTGSYLEDDNVRRFMFGSLALHEETVKPVGRTLVYLYVSDG